MPSWLQCSTAAALGFAITASARAAMPCDGSAQSDAAVAATCADFCAGKCSFYNASSGLPADQAKPLNLTLYRITPQHVLGVANHNTGDPPGDIGFFLSRKTLAAECAKDPGNIRCFLDGVNIFGKFEVEMDGAFGPYHMCNPTQGKDDAVAANWRCYQYCETPPKCPAWKDQRETADWHGPDCYCKDGRGNRTVGRVHRTSHHHGGPSPAWFPQKQCGAVGLTPAGGYCINGTAYQTLKHATPAQCCAACKADKCDAWSMADGLGADGKGDCQLMQDPMRYHRITDPSSKCISAYKDSSGPGSISGGVLGGYWYSTPAAGECKGDARPADGSGCTWRTVKTEKYTNASCVTAKVDAAVEKYNAPCFAACPGGASNTTSPCYLTCYAEAVNGNPDKGVKQMPKEQITDPWVTAQKEDDPAKGGCPALHPTHTI